MDEFSKTRYSLCTKNLNFENFLDDFSKISQLEGQEIHKNRIFQKEIFL